MEIFNQQRPHEALDMKCPAEIYQPSPRPYTGLPDIDYPFHDKTIVVTRCGRICLGNKKINFSQVFAGQAVGIKEIHDDIWLVSFMQYDLGTSIWRPESWNRSKIHSAPVNRSWVRVAAIGSTHSGKDGERLSSFVISAALC
jgi:hypothetical protein